MRLSLVGMIAGFGLLLLMGIPSSTQAQLEGKFELIGKEPAKHSQDSVVVEEFLNFTCPHCNNFRHASKSVFDKYGARVKRTIRPILFSGQADYPLRLYFIAERLGRGPEVKEMIFDASFKFGVNIYDLKVVGFLARSAGLGKDFEEQAGQKWVNEKIKESHALADQYGVQATPTLVVNGALRLVPRTGMQIFVNNFDALVGQILKPAS